MANYKGREIPWPLVAKFHREIAIRAERGFFQLYAKDSDAERWTSLQGFEPTDFAGPWELSQDSLVSHSFCRAIEQGQHESLFLGGPGYWKVERQSGQRQESRFSWFWNPILFREVEISKTNSGYAVSPLQGSWSINPLILGLMDRLSIGLDGDTDDLTGKILENAGRRYQSRELPLSQLVMDALISEFNELEADMTRSVSESEFPLPTPWVLFAPTKKFSAISRHLIEDYNRLSSRLEEDPSSIGGLWVLEDQDTPDNLDQGKLLPLISLNESQTRAAEEIISKRPLTVISGPPGCGKSQVVVASLLNAWARGFTVLFASNNNKAVDVVRERIEHFESEFPIAVRAGSLKHNNVLEVFRRTQNMVSRAKDESKKKKSKKTIEQSDDLLAERTKLQESLDSQVPQRIDQARSAAFRAYANAKAHDADLQEKMDQLERRLKKLELEGNSPEDVAVVFQETKDWILQIDHFVSLIRDDNRLRNEKQTEKYEIENRRRQYANEIGLLEEDAGDWSWLVTGPSPEQVVDWEIRLRSILEGPIEQDLEELGWRKEFDTWRGTDEAKAYANESRSLAEEVRQTMGELRPTLEDIDTERSTMETERNHLSKMKIPEGIAVSIEKLRSWIGVYAELMTTERKLFDYAPWSSRQRLERSLKTIEREIRPAFPLEIWNEIGVLNQEGRANVAPILEQTARWVEQRTRWEATKGKIEEIEKRFEHLRTLSRALKISLIPKDKNEESWDTLIRYCVEQSGIADEASIALQKQDKKFRSQKKLRVIAEEWDVRASGIPIRESWLCGQGEEFGLVIKGLAKNPSKDTVVAARSILYSGALSKLVAAWKTCVELQLKHEQIQTEILNIPEKSERLNSWWGERPSTSFLFQEKVSDWPEREVYTEPLEAVENWLDDHKHFVTVEKVELERQVRDEESRAQEQLFLAIKIMPNRIAQQEAENSLNQIKKDPDSEWPIDELNDLFSAFRQDLIGARIKKIDADIERRSFEDAKSKWLKRLVKDDSALRALDQLEKSIKRNKGAIPEDNYKNFHEALRAVPVWITTAQAAQAIPLEPNLFDVVIIDEASQCTITNLLPLMYRGKTLAVIGDENQLPAIPTIGQVEEQSLANKFEIRNDLDVIGHTNNDVFKAATDSLPRRRADVTFLKEHFRSDPQIIGFSNRYIYQHRLEIQRKPDSHERLPVPNGIHKRHVMGAAEQGGRGRSWVNEPEAGEVIEIIRSIKEGEGRSLSVGVVTPFSAQKDLLRDRLSAMQLTSEVFVDSAHGFQGDEREVMIFSPVIARGITASACRWVESPPNLINVALTRAQKSLYVVADFDYCRQQDGILRDLAKYVDDVQLLRDTSVAELELFSWMMVENLKPKIHPVIGDIEVDFVLTGESGKQVAIEVDGKEFHKQTTEQDKARDAMLRGQGYTVCRFQAREVFETPFEILHSIREELSE